MQTFLPYPDFVQSAKTLDYKRLGKQRIETKQILYTLLGRSQGWKAHPAVCMWRTYAPALVEYGHAIIDEWISRGYVDNQKAAFNVEFVNMGNVVYPAWLGDYKFHASHRAALLAKNFDYYKQFNWVETPKITYIWPRIN